MARVLVLLLEQAQIVATVVGAAPTVTAVAQILAAGIAAVG